jgi:long-subunit fatty acid transport protein
MRNRIVIVMALVAAAFGASAQNTDIEALSGLNFNFGNPGARALGMGGAFLGMADDASAAEANPAGLTALVRPEVTLEIRNSKTLQSLAVEGEKDPADPESIVYEDFTSFSRAAEVSFGSFVIPRGNFRIAGYFHSVLEFENEGNAIYSQDQFGQVYIHNITYFLGPNGYVDRDTCINLGSDCDAYRLFPYYTTVNIDLETWGLAMAYKVSDNFSIGASYKYQKFEEEAGTLRTTYTLPITPRLVLVQTADDDDYAYTVGFKLGSTQSKFNLGGVYKSGGSFTAPVTLGLYDSQGDLEYVEETSRPQFNVPDVYGLGLSYSPIPQLRVNVDAVQVNYSDLVDDMQSIYPGIEDAPQYTREDVTEIHVGAEYYFLNSRIPWALRAGWWQDPEHALKWSGPISNPDQAAVGILFPEGEDRDHFTLGIGIAFSNLQIDAAYDTSDKYKVGSLSAKYVF